MIRKGGEEVFYVLYTAILILKRLCVRNLCEYIGILS